ncbi:hypothetical protein Dimus_038718 [Dionaea muscipula]
MVICYIGKIILMVECASSVVNLDSNPCVVDLASLWMFHDNVCFIFPLPLRLQRLYYSDATANHMRWHAEHIEDDGKITHPSDGLASKNFNMKHPQFAAKKRNVRLGLCADGFSPFGMSNK